MHPPRNYGLEWRKHDLVKLGNHSYNITYRSLRSFESDCVHVPERSSGYSVASGSVRCSVEILDWSISKYVGVTIVKGGQSMKSAQRVTIRSPYDMVISMGFFANLEDIPYYLKWLPYMSYLKYGFEASMVAIYGLNRGKLECKIDYCHFKYPKKFLDQMSMNGDMNTYLIDIGVLSGLFVFLRICAYFVLRIKLFQNR
ncbi:unnamed protein product [Acanthoscelides obtectus]|uniref:Uncharacterized protein n=1 Tax=Acanthoscelides obtectus TaxID=200917 RepID=A0A9P0VQ97_ACAOB|nr:unnamed protein product [Acanthoscelides obtectus]CAK1689211.1 ATP-binding cassette sub-family G member 1 [Acanthoscelides obtectus]